MADATHPSIFDLLNPKPREGSPLVSAGDCGLIVKLDGSHEVFSTGVDNLLTDPATWGEREEAQMRVGRTLLALSVALQTPQIMAVLHDIADGILEPEAVSNVRKH